MGQYLLSICIPNYNRIAELSRLIHECVRQIKIYSMENLVEICVSDDCSPEDPTELIEQLQTENPAVAITYVRNKTNQGMDRNFLNSVKCSSGNYCWIIGNDDLLEEESLLRLRDILSFAEEEDIAVVVTPFDSYFGKELSHSVRWPLGPEQKPAVFDTSREADRDKLYFSIKNNCGFFGFLSNVIFRRCDWKKHGDMFEDKMDSIFIQVYMNMQTLIEGGKYYYDTAKLVKNYCEFNDSVELAYKIAIGLYNAVEYFFHDTKYRDYLVNHIVEEFVSVKFWDTRAEYPWLEPIFKANLDKVAVYNQYYVPPKDRSSMFGGKKVYIFGAGEVGRKVCRMLEEYQAEIPWIFDNNPDLWGKSFGQYIIQSPKCLSEDTDDFCVVIAVGRCVTEVARQLEEAGCRRLAVIAS